MVYILSIFFVLVEVSLPVTNYLMIISLPFLAYVSTLKKASASFWVVVISLVLSFQNTNFVKIFLIFTLAYFVFNFLYTNIGYNSGGILVISAIQLVIYLIFSYGRWSIFWIVGNFFGFLLVNFLYTRKRIE